MVVGGSFQHALGVAQRDTKVKRHLRTSSHLAKRDDEDEERIPIVHFQTPEEISENARKNLKRSWVKQIQGVVHGCDKSVQGEREKANIAVDLSLLKHYGVSILQEKWVHERREVDEVIDLVVVDSIIHKEVLNHELLDACFQYAKEKGTYQYEVLFKKLQQYYSDKKLAVLFVEAGKSSNLLEHSNELVKLLHQKWRQTSLYVQFRRLELSNKTPSTLLESSPLPTWVEYGNLLNVEPYQFLLDTMLPTNSFSLAKTLADHRAGKNGAIVIDLEDIMLNKWVEDAGNTGDGVFELLQINNKAKSCCLVHYGTHGFFS